MINLTITGDTEQEIDLAALEAGMTASQWLRVAIGAALEFRAVERPRASDLGKALSNFVTCQDPECLYTWAGHHQHDLVRAS